MTAKPKLAIYWAAACGGCEIAVVNLHEKILEIDAAFELIFCPCLLDTKKADIEALADGEIAVTLFNGAIRTAENREMAELLRRKSQTLIAFGSCAVEGCIPGLANLYDRAAIFKTVYLDNPSLDNPEAVVPQPRSRVPEGELSLPEFHDRVRTLAQEVAVDFFIPGCPPEPPRIWQAVESLLKGESPPPDRVLGAGKLAVCHECPRRIEEKKIKRLHRNHQITPDNERCILEQGLLCLGIATREGCGALCPQAGMPCTGCYGPPAGVEDQGAAMIGALGSVFDLGEGKNEEELAAAIAKILDEIPDYAGTFYKYSLPGSILQHRRGQISNLSPAPGGSPAREKEPE